MNKNVKKYERMLKQKIEARTGTAFEEWLEPQLHAAALCWQMLEKVHEELMKGALVTQKLGSKDQWYSEVNPLMPTYKELQRTIVLHYEALGLNFKSKPANIKEPVRAGGEEHDKLAAALKEIQGI
jgi:hypothetical protein